VIGNGIHNPRLLLIPELPEYVVFEKYGLR
jgi:hypothetical protein